MAMTPIHHFIVGDCGTDEGPESNGVLGGYLAPTAADDAILKSLTQDGLAWQDDGGVYTDFSTEWAEATADDVDLLPATPAVNDAFYVGNENGTFDTINIVSTTQGAGTWTIVWEYWNGTVWGALSGVSDGTTGFTAAAGTQIVTFTVPGDWATDTGPTSGTTAYWVRARVSAYTSVTTQPLAGQGYVEMVSTSGYTDDTTDFNDAGAGDVALLPLTPAVGDGFFIGHSDPFCKLKLNLSQAMVATLTIVWKYWNGSAWTAITTIEDKTAGWTAGTSTYMVSFLAPSDWAANSTANGPNSQAGYFVVAEVTAFTSMTTQPLLTQGWVFPNVTGALPFAEAPHNGNVTKAIFSADTVSATNADSIFGVINTASGAMRAVTFTQATQADSGTMTLPVLSQEGLVLVQIQEDGTTEFADVNVQLSVNT